MAERWAILVEGEGTAEEYGALFDTIADAAYGARPTPPGRVPKRDSED